MTAKDLLIIFLIISGFSAFFWGKVVKEELKETKTTLVEAKSDIDFSTLNPKSPGCVVTLPDGKALNTSKDQLAECFKTKPPLKPVEPKSTH